jgi:LPXTG-motif cell wall-anchored protein
MRKIGYVVLAMGLVLATTATDALASIDVPLPVPEISPTSLSAGLALLAGGVLLVRARRRK